MRDFTILKVDLTKGTIESSPIKGDIARQYLGGSGLGIYLLDNKEGTPPALSPESPLFVGPGLLAGTPAPTGSKTTFSARSPLTEIWGEATVGGFFGGEVKKAGFDGIYVTGQSASPVYLWVETGKAELREGASVWGKDTHETHEILLEQTHPKAQMAIIGPAGENLVNLASIMILPGDRAAGRCGLGAVMGSKRLKAIVVHGEKTLTFADRDALLKNVKDQSAKMRQTLEPMTKYGTSGGMEGVESKGDLPIKNWLQAEWKKGAAGTSGIWAMDHYGTGNTACQSCPIRCGNKLGMKAGNYPAFDGHGPEYETAAGFGALCLNDNYESIVTANDLCNRYGLDTISTSASIAFGIEAYERGILTDDDTGGLKLTWGNHEAIVESVELIGKNEGIGTLLGRGVRKAAEEIGQNASEFAVHSKGLEFPMHDPRAYFDLALSYATAIRGADHLSTLGYMVVEGWPVPELGYSDAPDRFSNEGRGEFVKKLQDWMAIFDSLGICKFTMGQIGPSDMAEWIRLVEGETYSVADLMRIGERLFTMKRLYSTRLGISRKDDTISDRILTWGRKGGGADRTLPHLEKMLEEYYEVRGWSEDGIPTEERLKELDIG
jgi:aldehyde:ferredoxin oxidoreductase